MNLHDHLISYLKQYSNALDENGNIKKWVVITLATNYDEDLIEFLLKDEKIKETFFIKTSTATIFKIDYFVRFLEQKNYLNDSYTKYKNHIGLLCDKQFLKKNDSIVLAWPFKDCILEGGQNTEEQTKNEVFFNEILAKDEITKLLEKKVISNLKHFQPNGIEEHLNSFSRDIEFNKSRGLSKNTITDNLIIKGNNLLTLHSIKKEFYQKIKLVYMDPPYNTGTDTSTFRYNNSFNHSTWLTFMKNRIDVSREMLRDDGIICLSIDDEEYAHLKVLCDEIMGRENYIGTVVVESNPRGRTTNSYFATCHDYALFYAKNINEVEINNLPLTEAQQENFDLDDESGDYRLLPFRRSGGTSTPEERPNSEFSLIYDNQSLSIVAVGGDRASEIEKEYVPKTINFLLNGTLQEQDADDYFKANKNVSSIMPIDTDGKRRVWRWSDREKILNHADSGDLIINKSNGKLIVKLKDRIKNGRKPKTIWNESKYDASSSGTMLLKKMFSGDKVFSYPKSIFTMIDTLRILTNPDSGDIILDPFAGSGSTAHALLHLNKEDGGNRQFILAEQLDYVENVTCERVHKVIKENGDGAFKFFELKKHNQALVDKIKSIKSEEDTRNIWNEIKSSPHLNFNVDISSFSKSDQDFMNLELNEQKNILFEVVDKNQLYVNISSIDDETFQCSEYDKEVTRNFYLED